MKILIVGGVAGGASSATRLRRLDENAEIVILEKDEHVSFANCGLPYYIGDEITSQSSLTLQTPQSLNKRFNIDVRNFSEAISIDTKEKIVKVKNKITGEEYDESYDKLILSPGAEPIKPPLDGIDNDRVFVLRNIPDTLKIKEFINEKKPKTAVVVGGGYIGVEMAENLSKTGMKVTIVEMADHLIAPLDDDMACDVHHFLENKGINIIVSNAVKSIENNEEDLTIYLNWGKLSADMLLMSVGVRPNSQLAKDAGLSINNRGCIIVNENMQTSDENIYAVGDVIEVKNFITKDTSFIPLAGPANKQGRIAADNILGINSKYNGTQGSSILKIFDMTVATTGINEKIAKDRNLNYDKVFNFSASHATYYPGFSNMSIKTIFEKDTGRILGAQIIGFDGVDKRCDILATAIRANMTAYDLVELELCYAPPFSSAKDPVNMVGFTIENVLRGLVKNYHWEDLDRLPKDGSVTLLDVRTFMEVENGQIPRFINIPLDDLRDNIDKLDKNKPIYVTCFSGLRSYIACRILNGFGFNSYNISGGYRLYISINS